MVRERAVAHGITLTREVAPEVDLVRADELRFKQVLLNLLSNAVKFTPDGGRVEVRARVVGGDLELTVSDTGMGIDPADQQRIFDSFQQGGRAARQVEGTGLGLTLTRRIVELHGGRLWLDQRGRPRQHLRLLDPARPQPRREPRWLTARSRPRTTAPWSSSSRTTAARRS